MLEETKYIDEIWNRYNEYMLGNIKNDFYETRVYNKENNINKVLRTAAMFITAIIFTIGVVYAGIAIYNNYIKHSTYSEYGITAKKDWVKENMKYSNDIKVYYSAITDYEDYLKYKEKFNDMTELNETDFYDNFVVLIVTQLTDIYKIDIDMIVEDEDILYIDLKRDDTNEESKSLHTLILPKEQYRQDIKLRRLYDKPESSNISLEELPIEYSLEQAISDGCIVLNNGKLISENENQIYEFIQKSQNNEECFIRIVERYDSTMKIQDVQYKDGIYLYASRQTEGEEEITRYRDNIYTEIKLYEGNNYKKIMLYSKEKSSDRYCLLDF